jgi:hypothetical protein
VTKIDTILASATGWTEAEFLALAMAALDQAGVSAKNQHAISKLLDVCVDCQEVPAIVNSRCEPCAEQYDDDRLELARDAEIDRRIDEARGK